MSVGSHTWVFVSHASADLAAVRKVRNHLEDKGASPLLFHLLSLRDPETFWPLIESEIQERNFFLYCESRAAEESVSVQRERRLVDALRTTRPMRIGSIRVDGPALDFALLDDFVRRTRVFPSYAYADAKIVRPYIAALRAAGFSTFDAPDNLNPEDDWTKHTQDELAASAREGWIVVFLSQRSLQSEWVRQELTQAGAMRARMIAVVIDPALKSAPANVAAEDVFDGVSDPSTAPQRLVDLLLRK